MRLRLAEELIPVVLPAFLFLLVQAPVASAAAEQDGSCGRSSHEAIVKAEGALHTKDEKAQAKALTCLVSAVKEIDSRTLGPAAITKILNALVQTLAERDPSFKERFNNKLNAAGK